ncbi:DICT sensory domain-containing protein [Natrarchaeobius oligotrophus]|uniref:Histidine kinase n=1 Tax=Natrarchaeobius chitinivorans TaxID=1679083 RepID=A0A3N6NJS0_NATCH|nr:DICT sensory domain-containing protein [Natrarchaeobius chitinivorans]RQG99382.1 histidine kinase [Natrarchaeobius chitinivorans]
MNPFHTALETVERHRKRLDVYTDDAEVAAELKRQFETRNADVGHHPVTGFDEPGFVIVRGSDDEFRGGLGLDQFAAVLSPEVHPPWEIGTSEADSGDLFSFLDNTLFTAYSRRQLLAAAREIEERAWRAAGGHLYTGFQREEALSDQTAVYERLADRGDLETTVFVADGWTVPFEDVEVVVDSDGEVTEFWFVLFDGGGTELQKSGLVAENRRADRYRGFWTYDPDTVDELIAYLESAVR